MPLSCWRAARAGCPLAGDIGKFPPITAVDGAALLGFCVSVGNLCGSPALGHVTRSALALIPGAAPGHPCGLCGREGMVSAGRLTGHSTAGNLKFAPPAPSWQPWEPIDIAVGDLPAFPQLLGDGTKPYRGPALLLGLDVLSQRRLIIEAGTDDKSRRRRLFIGAT